MSGSDRIKLTINGEEFLFEGRPSIKDILEKLEIKTPRVAVELNKKIVRKTDYENTHPSDGDRIEIVQFVGGG